ncbi:hypothetical protein ACFOGJ_08780 [Marinibaculum pumilum]|uniref:Chitin-binding type-3 domain-containing protein n=1 Tax=Marinibaculum pumilum TaxID=1766165 RepID=A0ABV7KYD7_9PROT
MAQEVGNSVLIQTWASSGAIIAPDSGKIDLGWQEGEQPPHEYMNWIHNALGQKVNHCLQHGIARWNDATTYAAGDVVSHDGAIYVAISGSTDSEPPSANWVLALLEGTAIPASSVRPGQVVQEVVATHATTVTSTSLTFATAGLQAAITPVFSDSVIEAQAFVPRADARRNAGTPVDMRGRFRIQNVTNAAASPEYFFGRVLIAGTSELAQSTSPIAIQWRYTVNSVAERTFQLQIAAGTDPNVIISTSAADSAISMILREIRQ